MVAKIEVWHPAAGDRLAVVGLGVDFPGCQDVKGSYPGGLQRQSG